MSGVYRQCPEFAGSVLSLQAVSGVYRQCLEFTGIARGLPAVSGVYKSVSGPVYAFRDSQYNVGAL